MRNNTLKEHITSIDKVFLDYPKYMVPLEMEKIILNGGSFDVDATTLSFNPESLFRVYDSKGNFVAVYKRNELSCNPVKMFL